MARVARVSAETNMFHVIVQGIAKEEIFLKDEFKLNYLGNIKKFKDEDGIKVLAYCIMPNHCHMLVQVPNVDRMQDIREKADCENNFDSCNTPTRRCHVETSAG